MEEFGRKWVHGITAWQRLENEGWDVTESGCWEYRGSRDGNGYGMVYERRTLRTHRVAFQHYNGEIRPDQIVRHDCDNPPCVNPAHLLLGTKLDNARDRESRNRGVRLRGEEHARTTLTEEDVRYIRTAPGSQQSIAEFFGVHQTTVSNIQRGKTWGHVQ